MRARSKLTRVTKGPGLKEIVANTKSKGVKVGVLSGQGTYPGTNVTIVENAFWQEFGTARIKARPFLRSTMKAQKNVYDRIIQKILERLLNMQESPNDAAKKLGLKAASDVQRTITVLSSPANKQSTIDRKNGKSNPLIDTGTLRRSISWEIVR